jgi:hypothetical protein
MGKISLHSGFDLTPAGSLFLMKPQRIGQKPGVLGYIFYVGEGFFRPPHLNQGMNNLDMVDELMPLRSQCLFKFIAHFFCHCRPSYTGQYVTFRAI